MKKRVFTLLLASSLVLTFTACGNQEPAQNETGETQEAADSTATVQKGGQLSTKDFKAEDYVTLGEFEGLEVEVPTYTVSQNDIDQEVNDEFSYFVYSSGSYDYKPLDKDTVEEGDLVNIDYKGLKDGVAFDGGTAQGQHLEIGSGQFIDGFESGLIGHKVGEEVSLNLTFPEQYQSEELAGQAVVFEVKINSIDEQTDPELSDELVQNMGLNLNTVDEFKQNVKEYLEEKCTDRNDSEKKAAVWDAVYKTCTVKEPPTEMVDDEIARLRTYLTQYAQQYQVSEDDFLTQYMGMTRDEYETQCKETAINTCKEKLAASVIAKKLLVEISDDELNEKAATEATNMGFASADAMFEQTGKGAYYDYLLGQAVDEKLLTVLNIKEKAPVSVLTEAEEEE